MTHKDALSCDDCYFRRRGLCAMTPDRICPTFRAATLRLQPAPPAAPLALAVRAAAVA